MGAGVLYSLTNLADAFGMKAIWGEATVGSAPFYEKVLQTSPVGDLFFIDRKMMRRIQRYYLERQKSTLAKTTKREHLR